MKKARTSTCKKEVGSVSLSSPLGPICLKEKGKRIVSLSFGETCEEMCSSRVLMDARNEIIEYFHGERKVFDIEIAPEGTDYQKKVWKAIMEIPYGELRTYEWVAEKAGGSPRSVGNALGANPIPIIIPCHRIIRKDGSLGGYSPGIEIKRFLIEHERLHSYESVLK